MEDLAARAWRTPVPPTRCVVDTGKVFPGVSKLGKWPGRVPMWLRAYGLQLGGEVEGVVTRWARLSCDVWIAEVVVEVRTAKGVVPLTIWADESAVRAVS